MQRPGSIRTKKIGSALAAFENNISKNQQYGSTSQNNKNFLTGVAATTTSTSSSSSPRGSLHRKLKRLTSLSADEDPTTTTATATGTPSSSLHRRSEHDGSVVSDNSQEVIKIKPQLRTSSIGSIAISSNTSSSNSNTSGSSSCSQVSKLSNNFSSSREDVSCSSTSAETILLSIHEQRQQQQQQISQQPSSSVVAANNNNNSLRISPLRKPPFGNHNEKDEPQQQQQPEEEENVEMDASKYGYEDCAPASHSSHDRDKGYSNQQNTSQQLSSAGSLTQQQQASQSIRVSSILKRPKYYKPQQQQQQQSEAFDKTSSTMSMTLSCDENETDDGPESSGDQGVEALSPSTERRNSLTQLLNSTRRHSSQFLQQASSSASQLQSPAINPSSSSQSLSGMSSAVTTTAPATPKRLRNVTPPPRTSSGGRRNSLGNVSVGSNNSNGRCPSVSPVRRAQQAIRYAVGQGLVQQQQQRPSLLIQPLQQQQQPLPDQRPSLQKKQQQQLQQQQQQQLQQQQQQQQVESPRPTATKAASSRSLNVSPPTAPKRQTSDPSALPTSAQSVQERAQALDSRQEEQQQEQQDQPSSPRKRLSPPPPSGAPLTAAGLVSRLSPPFMVSPTKAGRPKKKKLVLARMSSLDQEHPNQRIRALEKKAREYGAKQLEQHGLRSILKWSSSPSLLPSQGQQEQQQQQSQSSHTRQKSPGRVRWALPLTESLQQLQRRQRRRSSLDLLGEDGGSLNDHSPKQPRRRSMSDFDAVSEPVHQSAKALQWIVETRRRRVRTLLQAAIAMIGLWSRIRFQKNRAATRIQSLARRFHVRMHLPVYQLEYKLHCIEQDKQKQLRDIQYEKWKRMEDMRARMDLPLQQAIAKAQQGQDLVKYLRSENAKLDDKIKHLKSKTDLIKQMNNQVCASTQLLLNNFSTMSDALNVLNEKNTQLSRMSDKYTSALDQVQTECQELSDRWEYERRCRLRMDDVLSHMLTSIQVRCEEMSVVTEATTLVELLTETVTQVRARRGVPPLSRNRTLLMSKSRSQPSLSSSNTTTLNNKNNNSNHNRSQHRRRSNVSPPPPLKHTLSDEMDFRSVCSTGPGGGASTVTSSNTTTTSLSHGLLMLDQQEMASMVYNHAQHHPTTSSSKSSSTRQERSSDLNSVNALRGHSFRSESTGSCSFANCNVDDDAMTTGTFDTLASTGFEQ